MADIRAFRGWRYNLARVGELSDVVAPPYDVIDSELEQRLLERHAANVVRAELGKEPPGGVADDARYERAARCLHDWKQDGTLVEDSEPAIYVVHSRFDVDGRAFTRRGFMARLKLEPFGAGTVYPHEVTMPGPKADRLKLYRATGMNVSPVFGMYPDRANEVQELIEDSIRGRTPLEATDHLGVVSRMWPLTGDEMVGRVRALMGPRPIFIADGHHRYETAIRFREDARAAGAVRDDGSPANFCLMMCVGMNDPGLVILPTHRLFSGLSGLRSNSLLERLSEEFEVERAGVGEAGCVATWELIEADGGQNVLGFGTVADGEWLFARLRGTATIDRLASQHSAAWRELGVSILHELVAGELLRGQFSAAGAPLRFVHLIDEVLDVFAARQCDLACLVPPATMDHVQRIASAGERMPAKSTYFYPKLLTGLVFNPIA
jgi:uncharacterized protein (DUF1015 family)